MRLIDIHVILYNKNFQNLTFGRLICWTFYCL